jgi:hypothetical protein
MPGTMASSTYDSILSTTLANHMPKLVDNVFSARPLIYFLKEAGQIRTIAGGSKIVIPILNGLNSTAKSYGSYDSIDITPQGGVTAAEYQWKQFAATIAISGIEEAQNNSDAAIIDLLEAKTMQAEESISEAFDKMFIQSSLTSNATANSGKDWLGLAALVKDVTSTVGGISPTANSAADAWWKSTVNSTAAALSIGGLNTMYNTVAVGNDQPNMILTSQKQYEKYEALLQSNLRFTDTKTADAGFINLLFKGAPMVFDKYVADTDMYFLNTKYLRLVGHSENWFKPTPFVRPNNQDARYAQIVCYGELTISNRARQGVFTALT